jgi:hypothetical protein
MDAAPMNVVIATKVWGMYFFMIVCFCSGQTYNKILKHQTKCYVGKYDRIRSGADGLLYFFPSPYKGAE